MPRRYRKNLLRQHTGNKVAHAVVVLSGKTNKKNKFQPELNTHNTEPSTLNKVSHLIALGTKKKVLASLKPTNKNIIKLSGHEVEQDQPSAGSIL